MYVISLVLKGPESFVLFMIQTSKHGPDITTSMVIKALKYLVMGPGELNPHTSAAQVQVPTRDRPSAEFSGLCFCI